MQRKDYKAAAEALISVDIDVLDYPEVLTGIFGSLGGDGNVIACIVEF